MRTSDSSYCSLHFYACLQIAKIKDNEMKKKETILRVS